MPTHAPLMHDEDDRSTTIARIGSDRSAPIAANVRGAAG
jgi:hypothetical protein